MATRRQTRGRESDPREIVRWTRRYAQNRTISFLVQWVFILVMVVIIGIAAILTQLAQERGNQAMFTASVTLMIVTIVALAWFSMSRWSGALIFSITNRLYGREGYASYSGGARRDKLPLWLTALGGGLIVYHLVGVLFISFNYMPIHYLQPWSALYMTPYLIVMALYQRLGFWAWLWPLLYGLHALLLLLGLPVRFGHQYELLNIVVPVFGYGFVAILAGHIYSRYALYKLKTLTRGAIPDANGADVDNGSESTEGVGHG